MGRSRAPLRFRGSHEEKPGAALLEFGRSLRRRRAPRRRPRSARIRAEICSTRRAPDARDEQADATARPGFGLPVPQASFEPPARHAAPPHDAAAWTGIVTSSLHPQTQERAPLFTGTPVLVFESAELPLGRALHALP